MRVRRLRPNGPNRLPVDRNLVEARTTKVPRLDFELFRTRVLVERSAWTAEESYEAFRLTRLRGIVQPETDSKGPLNAADAANGFAGKTF